MGVRVNVNPGGLTNEERQSLMQQLIPNTVSDLNALEGLAVPVTDEGTAKILGDAAPGAITREMLEARLQATLDTQALNPAQQITANTLAQSATTPQERAASESLMGNARFAAANQYEQAATSPEHFQEVGYATEINRPSEEETIIPMEKEFALESLLAPNKPLSKGMKTYINADKYGTGREINPVTGKIDSTPTKAMVYSRIFGNAGVPGKQLPDDQARAIQTAENTAVIKLLSDHVSANSLRTSILDKEETAIDNKSRQENLKAEITNRGLADVTEGNISPLIPRGNHLVEQAGRNTIALLGQDPNAISSEEAQELGSKALARVAEEIPGGLVKFNEVSGTSLRTYYINDALQDYLTASKKTLKALGVNQKRRVLLEPNLRESGIADPAANEYLPVLPVKDRKHRLNKVDQAVDKLSRMGYIVSSGATVEGWSAVEAGIINFSKFDKDIARAQSQVTKIENVLNFNEPNSPEYKLDQKALAEKKRVLNRAMESKQLFAEQVADLKGNFEYSKGGLAYLDVFADGTNRVHDLTTNGIQDSHVARSSAETLPSQVKSNQELNSYLHIVGRSLLSVADKGKDTAIQAGVKLHWRDWSEIAAAVAIAIDTRTPMAPDMDARFNDLIFNIADEPTKAYTTLIEIARNVLKIKDGSIPTESAITPTSSNGYITNLTLNKNRVPLISGFTGEMDALTSGTTLVSVSQDHRELFKHFGIIEKPNGFDEAMTAQEFELFSSTPEGKEYLLNVKEDLYQSVMAAFKTHLSGSDSRSLKLEIFKTEQPTVKELNSLLDLISRKFVKPTVMTVPYAQKVRGAAEGAAERIRNNPKFVEFLESLGANTDTAGVAIGTALKMVTDSSLKASVDFNKVAGTFMAAGTLAKQPLTITNSLGLETSFVKNVIDKTSKYDNAQGDVELVERVGSAGAVTSRSKLHSKAGASTVFFAGDSVALMHTVNKAKGLTLPIHDAVITGWKDYKTTREDFRRSMLKASSDLNPAAMYLTSLSNQDKATRKDLGKDLKRELSERELLVYASGLYQAVISKIGYKLSNNTKLTKQDKELVGKLPKDFRSKEMIMRIAGNPDFKNTNKIVNSLVDLKDKITVRDYLNLRVVFMSPYIKLLKEDKGRVDRLKPKLNTFIKEIINNPDRYYYGLVN